jgi:hypothetical protein
MRDGGGAATRPKRFAERPICAFYGDPADWRAGDLPRYKGQEKTRLCGPGQGAKNKDEFSVFSYGPNAVRHEVVRRPRTGEHHLTMRQLALRRIQPVLVFRNRLRVDQMSDIQQ